MADKESFKKNPNSIALTYSKENKIRVEELEKRFDRFIENDFKTLCRDVKEIKDELFSRPTWLIAAIFWILSSTVVGLAVKIGGG